jgi:metal transporter CNNM
MAANDVPCCETMFWVYLLVCVALVVFAGLMSGLTLGLMSLSIVELEVMIKAGEPHDRKNAEKILPLVKNQHLLLCTLLIGNALAMEALPIFVDSLLPAWGAILISVTLILAFGEIIPQAVCSRYGLSIGAKLSFLVRLIIIVFFPLSYPISKLLDLLLGKRHSTLLGRAELKSLVYMHGNEAGKGGELTHDETTIISGALDMSQKSAKDAMTPVSQIFSLDINFKLDEKTMGLIASAGHSRIPIYSVNPNVIIGFILVKNLIKVRPEDETSIRDLPIRRMPKYKHILTL